MDKNSKRKKSNGVIGRSSKEKINQRIEVGERIIKQANYKISQKSFLEKYETKIQSMDTLVCPTRNTLKKDIDTIIGNIRKQKPNFEFEEPDSKSEMHPEEKAIQIGDTICDSIKQIRLSIRGYDHILFTSDKTTLTNSKQFEKNTRKKLNNDFEKSPVQPYNTSMAHLYIIYNQSGFEHYVSSFYRDNFDGVLYTSSHEYCSEIVFEYRKLKVILKNTFLILKSFYY